MNDIAAAQQGVLTSLMGEKEYQRLTKKYGHAVVWKSFDSSLNAIQVPTRKRILFRCVHWLRVKAERAQLWLEA